jgi:hypothetical protein
MIHWVWLHLETERASLHTDKYSMATIQELESFKLSDAVKFHEELNPRLWDNEKLDPEVRDQLLLIAEDFVEYLGLDNLKVEDVTISGSNAAYSYTPHSDLDLHILVDFNNLPDDPVYQELFTAKKTLYNDAHDITVREVPVELYVQDTNQVHTSLGEYSVVHDKWIRIPKKRRANFDEPATKLKYEKLGDLIELALKSKDIKRVKHTLDIIKRYRKSGLEKAGEFGPENLAFKTIRKQGLIQDLYDLKAQLHGEKLSIDEASSRDDAMIKIKKLLNTAGRTDNEKENIKRIINKMMKQWNIQPAEVGIREPVDPIKAKMAKSAYAKSMSSRPIKKGVFAENEPDKTTRVQGKKVKVKEYVDDVKSYRNPSPKTLYNLTKRSKHKHMRGMYHNGNTYWWDANDAIHADGSKLLGIPYDYLNRLEAAIDNVSGNYYVGGDDGVPTEITQRYDVEELAEASERHPYPYGYWIDITGEVVPVETYNGHESVGRAIMQKYDRKTKKGKIGDSLNLFYSGAIRVVTYNYPDMEIEICEPNRKAARSMVRLLRELQPTKVYYENNCKINGPKSSGTWQEATRWVIQQASEPDYYDKLKQSTIEKQTDASLTEASGYIPSQKEKNDPRFKMALTVDVKPDSIKKNAKAFGFKTSRAGIPPQARADGKIAEDLMREWKSFLAETAVNKDVDVNYHMDEGRREKSQTVTLYHGTCEGSAQQLLATGWSPSSGQQGGNMGQSRYLYCSTQYDDALWFAQEKGCDTVLTLVDIPVSSLRVDPEDGTADTLQDELNLPHELPGKVVVTKPIGPENFRA